MWGLLLASVIALAVIAVMLAAYTRFTTLRTRVLRGWHELDAALGERHMLVPTLVDTVRRQGPHDARLLDTATSCNLRAMAVRREADAQAVAEQALEGVLRQVIAAGDRHPELRWNPAFRALEHELSEIEDRIQELRVAYNADTRSFDRLVQTFPTLIFAHMFGFAPEPYFELEPSVDYLSTSPVDLSPWI
ncbi:MAG TPA: LemA family protein [Acidimicrobiia bacterium]|nr:LemA family protein [Acidimicrobiia bacterium]